MIQDKPLSTIQLLWAVRDSGLVRKAERQLLDALVLRCKPRDNYKSWPSYRQLAEDTGLHVKTLRVAAMNLKKAKLIKRAFTATSNRFFINAILIENRALEARARKVAARGESQSGGFTDEPLKVAPDPKSAASKPTTNWFGQEVSDAR